MTKFNELSKGDLLDIVDSIDAIFDMYGLDKDSENAFWECIDIGNKKTEMV